MRKKKQRIWNRLHLSLNQNLFLKLLRWHLRLKKKKKILDKDTSKENVAQENIQNQDVDQNQAIEVVTPNPIAENYNREFNGIKIKNGTSYELTDDMLNPNNLEINNKNVLIFHTHTCESYTESEDYKYIPSRKF